MTFLPEEWLAGAVASAGGASIAGSCTGTVEVEVGGGPNGKVTCHWVLEEGRLVAAGVGPADEPDVALTLTHPDAVGLLDGSADLNALFISGRMKVAGATGPLLELLAATKGDEFQAFRTRLHEATEV